MKKQYQKPQLLRHGAVERITLNTNGSGNDQSQAAGMMKP